MCDVVVIVGFVDKFGCLEVGCFVDFVVFECWFNFDVYENIVFVDFLWVEMVMIGGDILYGCVDWV